LQKMDPPPTLTLDACERLRGPLERTLQQYNNPTQPHSLCKSSGVAVEAGCQVQNGSINQEQWYSVELGAICGGDVDECTQT
jgi:hypothetical protein